MTSPDEVDSWLEYERYAVYGLGRSGRAACHLLDRFGKEVVASDVRDPEEFGVDLGELPNGVRCVFGENTPAGAEAAVVSPGLEPGLEAFEELERRSIPYFSEVDLAHDAASAPILAVTGTDGKTTTTSIAGAIAEKSRFESAVGGNIGRPLSTVVGEISRSGILVAEISAFQLWSCFHLRPAVAGFTNIADDHLDYFDSRADYVRAKRRLQRNSRGDDWVVYNRDDDVVAEWGRQPPARRATYGMGRGEGRSDLCVELRGDRVVCRNGGEVEHLFSRDQFSLPGLHNLADAMCAAAMTRAFGIRVETIRRAVSTFEPLPHRVEPVAEVDGVEFVNDSKATNVNSALAGLETLAEGYVAIVGGVDKGLDLGPLCEELAENASGVVAIGSIAERLDAELKSTGEKLKVERRRTLEAATRRAFQWARSSGGSVVLSPACSSFDMFADYTDRGESFREVVRAIDSAFEEQ